MKTHFLFGLILLAATGCGSSYDVGEDSAPDKYSFAQVNENAKDQSVSISTMDGEEITATDLFVGNDSTTFLQSATEERMTIATSSVETITIRHVGAGAVDGLMWGAIVGTPIGLLFGAAAASLEDNNQSMDPLVAVGTVGVTSALGVGLGALIRHRDEYIFQPKSSNSQKAK